LRLSFGGVELAGAADGHRQLSEKHLRTVPDAFHGINMREIGLASPRTSTDAHRCLDSGAHRWHRFETL
jgi:hypothetical protein